MCLQSLCPNLQVLRRRLELPISERCDKEKHIRCHEGFICSGKGMSNEDGELSEVHICPGHSAEDQPVK